MAIVKLGFNTDYGHDKFDVGLDETDLARILVEHGIPADTKISFSQSFEILRLSGEQLCCRQRARLVPSEEESCKLLYKKYGVQLTSLFNAIREAHGLGES